MKRRVAIVQPYLPTYRVPLFSGLARALERDGIQLTVVAGQASAHQAARGDATLDHPWLLTVKSRTLNALGRQAQLTRTSAHWRRDDAVILPLIGSSVDVYEALGRRRRGGPRVGLWGHVRSYVSRPNPLDMWLEKQQMRRSDHVFAYTSGGSEFAIAQGVAPGRVTTLMNTVDLLPLRRAIAQVSELEVAAFEMKYGLSGVSFAYIGGLDASKRVDFLASVMDQLWRQSPSTKLLVGGRGGSEQLLDRAVARGQVIKLGYISEREKALIAGTASALLCPGRIGLIAVEALEMKLPLVTTDWPFHAPEMEYLHPGVDVFVTPDDVSAFTHTLLGLDVPPSARSSPPPEMANMVARFRDGIAAMLGDRRG